VTETAKAAASPWHRSSRGTDLARPGGLSVPRDASSSRALSLLFDIAAVSCVVSGAVERALLRAGVANLWSESAVNPVSALICGVGDRYGAGLLEGEHQFGDRGGHAFIDAVVVAVEQLK
jgi:hypothetical protein